MENPLELTIEEGFQLQETVRSFGDPLKVFTGGEPVATSSKHREP
jgi:hypothetical protein